jgi:hypothetical protein
VVRAGPSAKGIWLVALVASAGVAACTYNFDKFAVEQDARIGAGGIAGLGTQEVGSGGGSSASGGAASIPPATGGVAGSTATTGSDADTPLMTGGASSISQPIGGDSTVATGGVSVSGGSTSVDAAARSGGISGMGGAVGMGGVTSRGGSAGTGGAKNGVTPMTGGNTTTGGATTAGGAVGTGGTRASGGTVGSGGLSASGGIVATGGTSTAACGTAQSTFNETVTFAFLDGGTSPLALGPTMTPVPAGAQLGYTMAGPTSNPTLCNSGCATLSMPFTSGLASYKGPQAFQSFIPVVDLVGATITFTIAIDNPGVPIQVQVFATGDASLGLPWAAPTTVTGGALNAYAAAKGFKDLSLVPTDGTNKYCASASGLIGLQLQNTAAISSSNAGTVTIYIGKITVRPPA